MLGEHPLGVDCNELPGAAGEHFPTLISYLGDVVVRAASHGTIAAFGDEHLPERHRTQVLNLHFARQGDDVAQLVRFTHGFVEDGGDDASVRMAGRSDVLLRKLEARNEGTLVGCKIKLKAHALGIVGAAAEAMVAWNLDVTGIVSAGGRL